MPDHPARRAEAPDDRPVDFRDLWAAVRVRWGTVFGVAALVVLVCVAYALVATPVYRASMILAPAEQERSMGSLSGALGQLGGFASLAGIGGLDPKSSATEEALAVMRSPEFLERFITDHQLMPKLFPGRWNASAGRWKDSWFRRTPTISRAVNRFNDDVLTATRDKKTGLVTLAFEWRERTEAATLANDLVARANAEMRSRAMAKAIAYTEFLNKELMATEYVSTREAISRLIEEQIKQRMVASVTQEYAFRTVAHAVPLDGDDFVRPKRVLALGGGLGLGLLLGAVLAVTRAVMTGALRPARSRGT